MTHETISSFLANELRMRYSPESILPYDDNRVIHRFFENQYEAAEAKNFRVMNNNISRMSYNISRSMGPDMESLPQSLTDPLTQHLLDELDIRPTADDFKAIRDKNLKMCVVGYGGAMVNMMYNMYTWAMELSEIKLFEKIVVFEKDTIDFSNILRMGKPLVFDYNPGFISLYDSEVNSVKTLKKGNMLTVEKELAKSRKLILLSDWLQAESAEYMHNQGYFFVGAPTLDTRTILQDKQFYFMGHSDYEVDIVHSPQDISSLAVETYGSVDIPVLLINLQIATAAFIKILAGDMAHERNEKLLSFDMKKYIEENEDKFKEIYNG